MEHKKLSSLIGLCILVTISQYEVTTQRPDPDGCCLTPVVKYVSDRMNYQNVTMKEECNAVCRKNESCAAVYWVFNTESYRNECWFKMSETSNIHHWTLFNCADDHRSYCWKANKAGVHQSGGKLEPTFKNETDCKRFCVDDRNCTGVVWNINRTECWRLLFNAAKLQPITNIANHWIIVRDLPKTFQKITGNIEIVPELTTESSSSYNGSTTQKWTKEDAIITVLATFLGVWTLIIIGISIYALKLKKCCSTRKKVDKAKVVDVAKVVEPKVNDYGEAKEDDDESYIDYQDLRRLENPPTTCEEEGCEYTAMELENMKEMEDDDNIYYNEDQ